MHDLDRRMFEATALGGELEEAEQEEQEFRELLGELVRNGSGRADEFGLETYETRGPGAFDDRSAREVALASELLEVQTSAELDRFLGTLLRRLAGGGRRFARSAPGRALTGVLKQAASQVLPPLDEPPGPAVTAPAGVLGGPDTKSAAELGLELEGLSREDREFEVARAFVRLADKATRLAAQAPPAARPADVAQAAVARAAGQHLPGLLAVPAGGAGIRQHSGRWTRQGDDIVVDGA
jgi:hypothetical protein